MDIKTKIRIALGLENEEVQFAMEDKLKDGTIIVSQADELAEGVEVAILSEDGEQMPIPVGSYETESGVGFVVEEEGVVAKVEEQVEEEEEDEMGKDKDKDYEDEEVEMSEEQAMLFQEIGAVVKELLEEVRKDITRINSELDEIRNENFAKDEAIVELQDENVKLSKELNETPSSEPVKLNKFKKDTNKVQLSTAEYNQLSRKEKYWYNLK